MLAPGGRFGVPPVRQGSAGPGGGPPGGAVVAGRYRRTGVPPYRPTASRRSPVPPQRPHVRAVAQLLEGALADLADPLAGDAEEGADLFEGQGLGAFLEAVVERENLAFTRGEMALGELVDELALESRVRHLLDLHLAVAGDPLAERAGAAV